MTQVDQTTMGKYGIDVGLNRNQTGSVRLLLLASNFYQVAFMYYALLRYFGSVRVESPRSLPNKYLS